MKRVRITAIRKASYPDLMEKYENPIEHACDVEEGQVWIANGWALRQRMGQYFRLCHDLGPWRGKYLRRLDEKSKVRHDFL